MSEQELQFNAVTGNKNSETARYMLESCRFDLNAAINMYFAAEVSNQANEAMDDDVQILEPEVVNQPDILIDESPSTSDGNSNDSDVRAPIAPIRGQLVAASFAEQYGNGTRRKRAPHPVFEQNLLEQGSSGLTRYQDVGGPSAKRGRRNLSELFRPPVDLISQASWDSLLVQGQKKNKWLLVNLQDSLEFASQILNRDVWSNETVKALVQANFFFTQLHRDEADGKRVASYYNIVEFPSVFIVDPRTGEFVQLLSTTDAVQMVNLLTDFTERFPTFEARDAKITADLRLLQPVMDSPCSSTSHVDEPSSSSKTLSSAADVQAERMKKVTLKSPEDEENKPERKQVNIPSNLPWDSYFPRESRRAPPIKLALRMPDGTRHTVSLPSNSELMALLAFIQEEGVDPNKHQFVFSFPRRVYSALQAQRSLQNLEIGNNELVYVEEI